MTIIAAADGSALGNPGPAGWAWVVDDHIWAAGGWPHGTNNMGELMAVLNLLEQTAGLTEDLHILCDSTYVINVITKWMAGWKRRGWRKGDGKPVLNLELIKSLDAAMAGRKVTFEWVKGHSGHALNEAADRRARAVAEAYQAGREPDSGPGFPILFDSADEDDLTLPGDEVVDPDPDDLFGPVDVPGLDPDVTDIDHVITLERALRSEQVRADPSQVAALVSPDWFEVDVHGTIWNRADLLAGGRDGTATDIEVIDGQQVTADQILLVFRASGPAGPTVRTSLWIRTQDNWHQRFHQVTPA